MKRRPVFVIGAQRSGTTLLSRLLAMHPDIYLTVNGKLLYYLITWVYRDPSTNPGRHLRLDEIAYSLARKPIIGVPVEDTRRMSELLLSGFPLARFSDSMPGEIVRVIWNEVYAALAQGERVIGDKYNEYLLELPEIQSLFPDARYIFLHRNCMDVAESMLRAFKGRPWVPHTNVAALAKWTQWNLCWITARSYIEADRRLEIDYQDLVAHPHETFRRICEFLNVEPARAFLAQVRAEVRQDRCGLGAALDVDWNLVRPFARDFAAVNRALGYDYPG